MPALTRGRTWARLHDDHGSLSAYFIGATLAVIPLVGLVVDGGGQVRATQRADLVADEAARTAAQYVEPGDAVQGDAIYLSPDAGGAQEAKAFVEGEGLTLRSVTFEPNRQDVTVTTETTYEPIFLGALGMGPWTITGTATAGVQQTDLEGKEYRP